MAVPLTTEPTFEAGIPELLFDLPYGLRPDTAANYDVSPDGQRFLMIRTALGAGLAQIRVILNWSEELKRLAPSH